jgi:hypothetical protein
VTVFPSTTTLLAGSPAGGTAPSLAADDSVYFSVNSGFLTAPSWYGSFTGVPAGASNLRLGYNGRASRTCTLNLAIYNWTSATWVLVTQQSIGTSEATLVDLAPPGSASAYRSASGEVRVRVTCSVFTLSAYASSSDVLSLRYTG